MFSLSTITIGIALLTAIGLVCFGIGRLLKLFHEEFRRDNNFKETSYPLETGGKKQ
jgi:hypothetical protein